MRRGVVVSMMGTLLLAGALTATAGQDQQLSDRDLRSEMTRNRKLAAYIVRNGCPDVAEVRYLSDVPPWDAYQVTLYYFGLRKEISFARAMVLGEPSVHLERYERMLTDQDIAALEPMARPYCTGRGRGSARGGAADRAEAAAVRAEKAASRVDAAAVVAERAADRAEAVALKMESSFERALRK